MKEYILVSTSGRIDISEYKNKLFNTKEYKKINVYTGETDIITTIIINNIEELEKLKNNLSETKGLIFSNRDLPDMLDYDSEYLEGLDVIEIYDDWRE